MDKLITLVLIIIFSAGNITAQNKTVSPIDVYIASQLQLRMNQNYPSNFHVPANTIQEIVEVPGALKIDIQTNRNWILHVQDLNGKNTSGAGNAPSESLRIRADGKAFISLNEKEINLSKGNKGAYGSSGNSINIDYELTFKKSQKIRNYQINLLYTLVAI